MPRFSCDLHDALWTQGGLPLGQPVLFTQQKLQLAVESQVQGVLGCGSYVLKSFLLIHIIIKSHQSNDQRSSLPFMFQHLFRLFLREKSFFSHIEEENVAIVLKCRHHSGLSA